MPGRRWPAPIGACWHVATGRLHLPGSWLPLILITTIFGLTVAIPVGVAFYTLRNRVIKTSTEINAITEDLFERFRGK